MKTMIYQSVSDPTNKIKIELRPDSITAKKAGTNSQELKIYIPVKKDTL